MKKYVLTGGPGSGKSTILLALEEAGEYIIKEAAEDIIKLQKANGILHPWEYWDFQERILNLQIKREQRIPEGIKKVFIDRGILDGLAYTKGSKTEKKIYALIPKYNKIFLIENFGETKTNNLRRENQKEALKLEEKFKGIYMNFGYEPIRITPGTVNERVRQIKEAM